MGSWITAWSVWALVFSAWSIVCLWVAFGTTRWGLRICVALFAFVLIWAGVLSFAHVPEERWTINGMRSATASVELLTLTAATFVGYYFLEWLDIRIIDIYGDGDLRSRSNAEFNVVDMLVGTVAMALVLVLAGRHTFYPPSGNAILYSAARSVLVAVISVTVLWSVISTSAIQIRMLGLVATSSFALWIASWLNWQVVGVVSGETSGLILCCAGVSFVFASILGVCGYRLVIPEDPPSEDLPPEGQAV